MGGGVLGWGVAAGKEPVRGGGDERGQPGPGPPWSAQVP